MLRYDTAQASIYQPFFVRPAVVVAFENIPPRYRHPRLLELAYDPDRKLISITTLREAMAAIEAVYRSHLHGPIYRAGPGEGLDFHDGYGTPVDIKTPVSSVPPELWKLDIQKTVLSICTKLRSQTKNAITKAFEPPRIVLDTTFLTRRDRESVLEVLWNETTPEERARIYEVTLRL